MAHLVALDIDGTTITHTGELREPVRLAIRDTVQAGHHVVIATGRSIVATTPILNALDLTHGWAVCSNGAVTLALDPATEGGYRIHDAVTFDPGPALELIRHGLPEAIVAVEELGVGFRVNRPYPDGELMGEQTPTGWEELMSRPTTRVTVRDPEASSEDFIHRVEQLGLHGVNYNVGYTAWLDIAPEGVSKGSALELVRRTLRVEPDHTVAVGDQRNDLEMLHWAARGVAMGNAPDVVKDIANEVTGSIDEDGLEPILRSLPGMRARTSAPLG